MKKIKPNSIITTTSFNLGYNIILDSVGGSEAGMVIACHDMYDKKKKDDLPICLKNALKGCMSGFGGSGITSDVIALQEVPKSEIKAIHRYSQTLVPWEVGSIVGTEIMLLYNKTKLGKGINKSHKNATFGLGPTKPRGIQVVYFPQLKITVVNLHACHKINLKHDIEYALKDYVVETKLAIVCGDFNDGYGKFPDKTLYLFGKELFMSAKPPKTCCYDSDYAYSGDYILSNKLGFFGLPPGYVRGKPLMSDHDPVMFRTLIL